MVDSNLEGIKYRRRTSSSTRLKRMVDSLIHLNCEFERLVSEDKNRIAVFEQLNTLTNGLQISDDELQTVVDKLISVTPRGISYKRKETNLKPLENLIAQLKSNPPLRWDITDEEIKSILSGDLDAFHFWNSCKKNVRQIPVALFKNRIQTLLEMDTHKFLIFLNDKREQVKIEQFSEVLQVCGPFNSLSQQFKQLEPYESIFYFINSNWTSEDCKQMLMGLSYNAWCLRRSTKAPNLILLHFDEQYILKQEIINYHEKKYTIYGKQFLTITDLLSSCGCDPLYEIRKDYLEWWEEQRLTLNYSQEISFLTKPGHYLLAFLDNEDFKLSIFNKKGGIHRLIIQRNKTGKFDINWNNIREKRKVGWSDEWVITEPKSDFDDLKKKSSDPGSVLLATLTLCGPYGSVKEAVDAAGTYLGVSLTQPFQTNRAGRWSAQMKHALLNGLIYLGRDMLTSTLFDGQLSLGSNIIPPPRPQRPAPEKIPLRKDPIQCQVNPPFKSPPHSPSTKEDLGDLIRSVEETAKKINDTQRLIFTALNEANQRMEYLEWHVQEMLQPSELGVKSLELELGVSSNLERDLSNSADV